MRFNPILLSVLLLFILFGCTGGPALSPEVIKNTSGAVEPAPPKSNASQLDTTPVEIPVLNISPSEIILSDGEIADYWTYEDKLHCYDHKSDKMKYPTNICTLRKRNNYSKQEFASLGFSVEKFATASEAGKEFEKISAWFKDLDLVELEQTNSDGSKIRIGNNLVPASDIGEGSVMLEVYGRPYGYRLYALKNNYLLSGTIYYSMKYSKPPSELYYNNNAPSDFQNPKDEISGYVQKMASKIR